MDNNNDNQTVKVTGEITAKFYDQSKLNFVERMINNIIRKFRYQYPKIMRHYILGDLVSVDVHKNVICNNGFNAVCKRLVGDTTYTGEITHMLLGDGQTGPAAATDTELENEVYRNETASGTDEDNVAYLTAYFTETECQGTFREFGNAIDGSATANTGRLWSHLKGLVWVKSNTTTLVVSCKYTLVSA